MPEFMHGLDLCGLFYNEIVKPILDQDYPGLRYSAALIGYGSEVLGYDNVESTDHFWSPRVDLFLTPEDHAKLSQAIQETLRHKLPYKFRGYVTNMVYLPGGDSKVPVEIDSGPVNHLIRVETLRDSLIHLLGIEPDQPLTVVDWLTFPQQRLLEVTAGRVYHDGSGDLTAVRDKLAYYPHDVWLYKMAGVWRRIEQEEPFVGRAGSVGDELGSQVTASRLVRDLMNLCFLMEKRYAPYPKWFGTAFARLKCAPRLLPILESVFHATGWHEREERLTAAYEIVATMHNDLGLTRPLPAKASPFHGRPYLVIHGNVFSAALHEQITDEAVKRLPPHLGGIDEMVYSTDVLSYSDRFPRVRVLYDSESGKLERT